MLRSGDLAAGQGEESLALNPKTTLRPRRTEGGLRRVELALSD